MVSNSTVNVNGTWELWSVFSPFPHTLLTLDRICNNWQSPRLNTERYRTPSVSPLLCLSQSPLIPTETELGRSRGESLTSQAQSLRR